MTSITRVFLAMALPIVAISLMPSAAMAQSYTGNWPITVSKSHYGNGTYCVALTDDGSQGFPHSGYAAFVPSNGYAGLFTVINGIVTVTIPEPYNGELEFQVFVAHASAGRIRKGAYDLAGGPDDSGVAVFGAKNGC
ncbi:MAG: hypothetical protein WA609_18230 [Terriglobales bacterium]